MEFRLLGPLEARSDAGGVPLGGPKQRAVLAVLLLQANRVVSKDQLIDSVWGEHPPKRVDAALQNVILVNPAGHMHFASNWYGGRNMYREGPWEWQKPYSFTVLHAPILIGLYKALTRTRVTR